jgi:hypothetical protein
MTFISTCCHGTSDGAVAAVVSAAVGVVCAEVSVPGDVVCAWGSDDCAVVITAVHQSPKVSSQMRLIAPRFLLAKIRKVESKTKEFILFFAETEYLRARMSTELRKVEQNAKENLTFLFITKCIIIRISIHEKTTFSPLKVTFRIVKVILSSLKVTFRNVKVTFSAGRVTYTNFSETNCYF